MHAKCPYIVVFITYLYFYGFQFFFVPINLSILSTFWYLDFTVKYGGPFSPPLRLSRTYVPTHNRQLANSFAELKPINNRSPHPFHVQQHGWSKGLICLKPYNYSGAGLQGSRDRDTGIPIDPAPQSFYLYEENFKKHNSVSCLHKWHKGWS